MMETLSVSLSGPAFSFLLYENLKSKYSQEGFLLGELVEKETSTITDNDQAQVHISRTIQISCAVPCPLPHFFYNGVGKIDPDTIKNFLSDMSPKVVAWYKYKHTSNLSLTFREKLIHQQLSNYFNLPPEFFTCCLLTSDTLNNSSTHTFSQTFVRYHNQKYDQVPMHIVNLSDPPHVYKTPEPVSDTFVNIVNSLEIDPRTAGGPGTITKIHQAIQKHTDNLVEELAEAEERLFQLENEVKLLRDGTKEKYLSASNDEKNPEITEGSPTKSKGRGKLQPAPKSRRGKSPIRKNHISGRFMKTTSNV